MNLLIIRFFWFSTWLTHSLKKVNKAWSLNQKCVIHQKWTLRNSLIAQLIKQLFEFSGFFDKSCLEELGRAKGTTGAQSSHVGCLWQASDAEWTRVASTGTLVPGSWSLWTDRSSCPLSCSRHHDPGSDSFHSLWSRIQSFRKERYAPEPSFRLCGHRCVCPGSFHSHKCKEGRFPPTNYPSTLSSFFLDFGFCSLSFVRIVYFFVIGRETDLHSFSLSLFLSFFLSFFLLLPFGWRQEDDRRSFFFCHFRFPFHSFWSRELINKGSRSRF